VCFEGINFTLTPIILTPIIFNYFLSLINYLTTMDPIPIFIIYALMFHLAVIAAGIVAIVLGYKLFAYGVRHRGATSVDVQAGQVKLTLDNAGPGTIFALFGASIIVFMLFQGSPELIREDIPHLRSSPSVDTQQKMTRTQLKGKGDNEPSEALQHFEQAFMQGVQQQQAGNAEAAIEAYNKALSDSEVPLSKAAAVFNQLAWIYNEQNRIDEALALARVATTVYGNNPAYFDTLALILLGRGEHKAAEQAAKTAVDLDPTNQDHQETLQRVREAGEAGQ
jgi:tetratricopeptide (TPR) repeat protein